MSILNKNMDKHNMIIETDEIPNYDKLNIKMQNLYEDASKDIDLNEMNIREKALCTSTFSAKWCAIQFSENCLLSKMKDKKEQMIEDYTLEHGQLGIPKFASQGEAIKSKDIQKLSKAISVQEEVVKFAFEISKIISNFGFTVKNSLEILKLES